MIQDHVHFFLPYRSLDGKVYWKCDCEAVETATQEKTRKDQESRLEEELEKLRKELDAAEADVRADMGDEAWESGGWYDVSKSVISMMTVSPEAKREMAKMLGIGWA